MGKPENETLVEVFSSGGGTQSTAIAALIVQGRLPRPDVVVIADTGFEKSTTWYYLDGVVRPELAKLGLEVHRVGPEWATKPPHGNRFISHNGNTVLVPGFSSQVAGERGKMSGFCSKTWKVDFNIWLARNVGDKQKKAEPVDEQDICRECGDSNVGGDGWDGLCGNCADREAVRKGEI